MEIVKLTKFKKDMKRLGGSGKHDLNELIAVVSMLVDGVPLPAKYRDHGLVGEFIGLRECHIRPDWLLIYRLDPGVLVLVRSGSHAELFG